MLDAVLLSDVHLGSDNCQAKRLCELLERVADGELTTARLILNGDVFDSIDFRRLNKSHWKVLSLIRKLSDQIEIIWLCGNHDGSAEIVSHLLGVAVMDDFVLESGGRRILILHGHVFDEFIDNHPVLTWLADCGLRLPAMDRPDALLRQAGQARQQDVPPLRPQDRGALDRDGPAARTAPQSAAATRTPRRRTRTADRLLQQRLLDRIALYLSDGGRRRHSSARLPAGPDAFE